MLVLAKSIEGREFLYNAYTARRVPRASAEKIRDALNRARWALKPGEVWYIHEVDQYDKAYIYASDQYFRIYRGQVYTCK